MMLEGRGISVRFGGVAALQDIDIALDQGDFLGLIGPNGAGKTTLVNVLTGFQQPTSGTVTIDGTSLAGQRADGFARRGIARTFQNVRLFRDLTVEDNINVARANGPAGKSSARTPQHLLDWFGLSARAGHLASDLSYGEERMLGIARSLAMRPAFILLDEPAAGLNDRECDGLVRRLAKIPDLFGCGVVLVEHNMRVVMAVSRRVHVIEYGRTIACDTPDNIKTHPEVLRAYLA